MAARPNTWTAGPPKQAQQMDTLNISSASSMSSSGPRKMLVLGKKNGGFGKTGTATPITSPAALSVASSLATTVAVAPPQSLANISLHPTGGSFDVLQTPPPLDPLSGRAIVHTRTSSLQTIDSIFSSPSVSSLVSKNFFSESTISTPPTVVSDDRVRSSMHKKSVCKKPKRGKFQSNPEVVKWLDKSKEQPSSEPFTPTAGLEDNRSIAKINEHSAMISNCQIACASTIKPVAKSHTPTKPAATKVITYANILASQKSNKEELKIPCSSQSPEPKRKWLGRDNETFVDTEEKLHLFLKELRELKKGELELFCDMEGDSLRKKGTISLLQITIKKHSHTWILDITVLKVKAFDTRCDHGFCLREILENPAYLIAWFDVRNDQNALFFHYNIRIGGVVDIQLMELATRQGFSRGRRLGLKDCILREVVASGLVSMEEVIYWLGIKNQGRAYFTVHGYGVFDTRPLLEMVMKYAGQDTIYMPILYDAYLARMDRYSHFNWEMVSKEAKLAVDVSCTKEYDQNGAYRGAHAIAPAAFWADENPYDFIDDYEY